MEGESDNNSSFGDQQDCQEQSGSDDNDILEMSNGDNSYLSEN